MAEGLHDDAIARHAGISTTTARRHIATIMNIVLIGELMEAGTYRPVIDMAHPIENVVEAARYVETQQRRPCRQRRLMPGG